MKLLFIGDIVGRPGRDLVKVGVPALVARHGVDLVIANGENAAAGFGITRDIGEQLFALGIDVHDLGQPHLGQERSPRLHPARAAAAAPRQLPGRHARPRRGAGDGRQRRARRRRQRDGSRLPRQHRRPVHDRGARSRAAQGRGRARSCSSTYTPRSPPRRSRWAGTSTARPPPSSARTRTCRRPMPASCRKAPPTSPTSA